MPRFRTRLALLGPAALAVTAVFAPIQAAAAPVPEADRQWVALGDSFTAGGIRAAGEVFEVPRDGCERTDRSYPQVIDRDLGSLFGLTNVSCGGATIEHITGQAQEPAGHHYPPYSEDPDYPFPMVPPQSIAAGPGTDVITVGVGLNDLGFGAIFDKCLELGVGSGGVGAPCREALAAGIPARLREVAAEYDRMFTVLHDRAPHARILAIGYPTIVPEDTSKCRYNDLVQFGSITPRDLDWLRRDVLEPLNNTIERSAGTQETARFVDLYTPSKPHSVCDDGKWVEGFVTALDQPSFFHPNARGHRNAADHIEAAMLDSLD